MAEYKRIEQYIGRYIADHYHNVVEVGVGQNFTAAALISQSGINVTCTDLMIQTPPAGVFFFTDDIFSPDTSLFADADLVYSIRPAEEMIPPMAALAGQLNCDLIVYHLGFEGYKDGGEIIDCGVILHRYHKKSDGRGSEKR